MFTCFDQSLDTQSLDRRAFKFKHRLMGHPALELPRLAEVLPALPKDHVYFSESLLRLDDNFEGTFKKKTHEHSLEEVIETLRQGDAYVMVRSPEVHPAFADLYRDLMADVQATMRARGLAGAPMETKLYLFIASPNSVTPFHIDRYSTFLMQFRGSKQVCVFDQWDDRVVTPQQREAYTSYVNTKLSWAPSTDALGQVFDFSPGEALHIPFIAGHHVRNGPDDVSISMSVIFNTLESQRWRNALCMNHTLRPMLGRMGAAPHPVATSDWRDSTKSLAWKALYKARQLSGRT